MVPSPEQARCYIANGIDCLHLEVEGARQPLFAPLVRAHLEGLRLVQRHQKVYATLGDRMKSEIHALSFKALTPEEHVAGK